MIKRRIALPWARTAIRYGIFGLFLVATVAFAGAAAWRPGFAFGLIGALPLAALGIYDLFQRRHSLLRNYPVVGHLRWLSEAIRPEFRQYFGEDDTSGRPFNRINRSLVYERAKSEHSELPFGTELDVYDDGYEFLAHSVAPKPEATSPPRVKVGGPQCRRPYDMALLNISAMSFGALSANAILALNAGAKAGGFAHDTGEGGLTRYHLAHGGDLVWEIGSGYFGCRTKEGGFDRAQFRDKAAAEAVKCVSLKLSQGAKPGHGGVMPAAKVTKEIAEFRGVPAGEKCVSPAYHSAFSTPREMLGFLQELRELSGGKPVGFKLCIGQPWEFLSICKAIRETGVLPDFVIVDGGEGGTGAAPIEFEDHVGMPLTEALIFVDNALLGAGLRRDVRVGCAGKIVSGFDVARRMAQGADYCNAARAMMFALGCIQAQRCHTNRCPVGVTTHDPRRTRALVVADKAKRVERYQRNTIGGLGQIVAALGLEHPGEIRREHLFRRISPHEVRSYAELYARLAEGELAAGASDPLWRGWWDMASAGRFGMPPAAA